MTLPFVPHRGVRGKSRQGGDLRNRPETAPGVNEDGRSRGTLPKMSGDTKAIIGTIVGTGVVVAGLLSAQISSVNASLSRRIDDVHASLNGRIDDVHASLDGRIGDVHASLSERIDDGNASD